MQRSVVIKYLVAAAILCGGFVVDIPGASADKPVALRIATLAPRGSLWMKVFEAWNQSLKKKTNGSVKLVFYPGGVAGDERDAIRKIRSGQLDGAAVTAVGLGQIVRSVLVLQTPGLFREYKEIDLVRQEMATEFEKEFSEKGFQLIGWGDAGRGRLFSNIPVRKPQDLRKVRMWTWRDDPVLPAFLGVVGTRGVPLGLPEVYPALQTKRIDAVPASALAAVALQWFTQTKYVTKQADSILIGATLLSTAAIKKLSKEQKSALLSTGKRAHATLSKAIRKDDNRAYQALKKRGLTEVDTSKYEGAWKKAAEKTRKRLAGKLYSKELLERVESIAAKARK